MGQQTMHHDNSYGGVYGTLLSIVLFFVARFALSDIAAVFAILAGATTAGYNIWRWRNEYKKRKQ